MAFPDCNCQPLPETKFYELFCAINESLNSCVSAFPGTHPNNLKIFLIIDFWYTDKRGKPKKITEKIGGWGEIISRYRNCKAKSAMKDEDLWTPDPQGGCDKGNPDLGKINQLKDPERGACLAWAKSVTSMMNRIYQITEKNRSRTKCLLNQGENPPPDPRVSLSCGGIVAPVNLGGQPKEGDNKVNPIRNPQP